MNDQGHAARRAAADIALIRRLPPREAAKKNRLDERMVPSVLEARFGFASDLQRLTPAATALGLVADNARATFESIYREHFNAMSDPLETEAARLVGSAKSARAKLDAISRAYDAALASAERESEEIRMRLDAVLRPPTDAGSVAIDAEVRAMLRTATPDEQLRIAREFPRAVATAPAVLTGLADEVHRNIRESYLAAIVPDIVAQRDDLMAAVDSAGAADKALAEGAREIIDFDTAATLAEASAAARAA